MKIKDEKRRELYKAMSDVDKIADALARAQEAADRKVQEIDRDRSRSESWKIDRKKQIRDQLEARFEEMEGDLLRLGDLIADAVNHEERPSDPFDFNAPSFQNALRTIDRFGDKLPIATQKQIAQQYRHCADGLALIDALFKEHRMLEGSDEVAAIRSAAQNDFLRTQGAADDLYFALHKRDVDGIQRARTRLHEAFDRHEGMTSAPAPSLTDEGVSDAEADAQFVEDALRERGHFQFLNRLDGDQADGTTE